MVEGLDFVISVEANRLFKCLRRVVEISSASLTSSWPVTKGTVIREPVNFVPIEAASSRKGKSHVETWSYASTIFVCFIGNLMDLIQGQCGKLLRHLGIKADVASVAQYSIDQTRNIFCIHMFRVRIMWIFLLTYTLLSHMF